MEAVGRATARVVEVEVVAVIYAGEGVVMVTRRSAVATLVAAISRLEAALAAPDRSRTSCICTSRSVLWRPSIGKRLGIGSLVRR